MQDLRHSGLIFKLAHSDSLYTPDFIVKKKDGNYLLVETKGREDLDVPLKVMAAVSWCKAASSRTVKWEYLYVPQAIFSGFSSNKAEDLVRTCVHHCLNY